MRQVRRCRGEEKGERGRFGVDLHQEAKGRKLLLEDIPQMILKEAGSKKGSGKGERWNDRGAFPPGHSTTRAEGVATPIAWRVECYACKDAGFLATMSFGYVNGGRQTRTLGECGRIIGQSIGVPDRWDVAKVRVRERQMHRGVRPP